MRLILILDMMTLARRLTNNFLSYVPLHSTRAIADKRGKEIPFFTVVTE